MKIVYFTTRLPYPSTDGRALTLYQWIEMMSKENEVYIVSLNQGDRDPQNQPSFIKEVHVVNYPSFLGKLNNIFIYTFFVRRPLQSAVVYSKKSRKKFEHIVRNINPDVVICDMVRCDKYMKRMKNKYATIMDINDLLSVRYFRSIERKDSDALGQFKNSLPKLVGKIFSLLKMDNRILKGEAKKIAKLEKKCANEYDRIVLLSPVETEKYNQMVGKSIAINWPVCVKTTYPFVEKYDKNQICYVGNMDYAPNQDTLLYLANNILPKLPLNYKLLVIGRCSDESYEKFKEYDRITFTREVPSVKEYVQNSLCLLAPIQFGSGIKTKVLESMAFGVPVITSEIGAEGLSSINGKDIIIAQTVDDYVKAINDLGNEDYRNTISKNGKKYIEENHLYANGEKIINSSLNELVGR